MLQVGSHRVRGDQSYEEAHGCVTWLVSFTPDLCSEEVQLMTPAYRIPAALPEKP